MIELRATIAQKQKELEQRPLFRVLESPGTAEQAKALVPAVTFFVMTFQDVLRLNHERVEDPELKAIAKLHRDEDRGHEQWFLHDLRQLEVQGDIKWLFSDEHCAVRDVSYAILSEVFRTESDLTRLAIPLVLEATGHVYFSRAFNFFKDVKTLRPLKYFSKGHWNVEESHGIFEKEQEQRLNEIALSPAERQEAEAMCARVFAAVASMTDEVYRRVALNRSA